MEAKVRMAMYLWHTALRSAGCDYHKEWSGFCRSYGLLLSCVSAILPLRIFIATTLPFCIIPCSQPASFLKVHALQVRQSRDVLFVCIFLSTVIGTRSACCQNGQLLFVQNSEAYLVGMCRFAAFFMLPIGIPSSSLDTGEKVPLSYSSMT